jgi:hypothetical protein
VQRHVVTIRREAFDDRPSNPTPRAGDERDFSLCHHMGPLISPIISWFSPSAIKPPEMWTRERKGTPAVLFECVESDCGIASKW